MCVKPGVLRVIIKRKQRLSQHKHTVTDVRETRRSESNYQKKTRLSQHKHTVTDVRETRRSESNYHNIINKTKINTYIYLFVKLC